MVGAASEGDRVTLHSRTRAAVSQKTKEKTNEQRKMTSNQSSRKKKNINALHVGGKGQIPCPVVVLLIPFNDCLTEHKTASHTTATALGHGSVPTCVNQQGGRLSLQGRLIHNKLALISCPRPRPRSTTPDDQAVLLSY